jgi:nicotinate-nucleotide--dimethylbenzimidazole phosphoribosyltransferase
MKLDEALSRIQPVSQEAYEACIARFDQVAKPVGSLGKLEGLLARIAAVTGSLDIDIGRKAVAVFCADNGVTKKGVANGGFDVTTAVCGMIGAGKASVNVMAKICGAEVFPVDIGMVDTVRGLADYKLMRGTNDITEGPAMSRETAEEAVTIGIETVKELKDKGFRLIATGEAGIGNTTTSSAICACLLGCPAGEVTGRGAGLSDEGLKRKIASIEQAIAVNKTNPADPMDVLHKLGGLDIAAMAGLFLGGAAYRVPIVMDGFISGAAALLATRLCADVSGYILPSHESGEPGARHIMEAIGFSPILQAGMRLGEGTGAVALFPLLDMALAVYRDAATYADIQIDQYTRAL